MKITKLGHCCLRIECVSESGTGDKSIVTFLTDPGSYTDAQNTQTGIDAVVISHEHSDHLHIESLKTVLAHNPNAIVISNDSVGTLLSAENISFSRVAHGEEFDVKGVRVRGFGTVHAPIFRDYEQVENTGYFFADRLFYPGDAFTNPGVAVDILAFPVTGPWCNISDSMNYLLSVKPNHAFGVHDGNLVRPTGITKRLPEMLAEQNGIQYHYLELGKKYEF